MSYNEGRTVSQRSIILNVAPSCFVACVGCYNNFADSWQTHSTISAEYVLEFLRNAKDIGYSKVTLGGGDPLSRPDIVPLVTGIRSLGFKIHLDTVGTAFLGDAQTVFHGKGKVTQVQPESLKSLVDLIGIPLDGGDSATAALFRRGRPGFFDEQKRIIETLVNAGFDVCVNTVVSQYNIDKLAPLFEQISQFQIREWQLFQFMPIGPLGSRNQAKLWISENDFSAAIESLSGLHANASVSFTLKPKSIRDRTGRYLIVDDGGRAWSPTGFDNEVVTFGNIKEAGGFPVLELVNYLDIEAQRISEKQITPQIQNIDIKIEPPRSPELSP